MRISPIINNQSLNVQQKQRQISRQTQTQRQPVFMASSGKKMFFEVSRDLEQLGVLHSGFKSNDFVANCVGNVAKIFKEIYPFKKLPSFIYFDSLGDGSYGQYDPQWHTVKINSDLSCFDNKEALEKEMQKAKNVFFLPNEKSTTHYLRTFVHEFGHNAHHRNLEERGHGDAIHAFGGMRIPNTLGRFIARFKLGNYAATNMTEFMAERISKDICTSMYYNAYLEEFSAPANTEKLDYSNIFEKKWNCRYVTPQSYLDYYTQQVWNGDIEGANRVLNDMEEYMAALENGHSISAVEIERPCSSASLKQNSALGKIDRFFGSIFSTPESLDKKNRLTIGED